MSRWMAWLLALLACRGLTGCAHELTPIDGTTIRVGKPENAQNTELELQIFTTRGDCAGAQIPEPEFSECLPYVDRANGEVHLGFRFRLDGEYFPLPLVKDHLDVVHQGMKVLDGRYGMAYRVIPHNPVPTSQLYVLLIDGSSSMNEHDRIGKVRRALLRKDVQEAFFPGNTNAGVVLLQFTDGKPEPVGGKLQVLTTRRAYTRAVKQLGVLSGYTHLYDAIQYATGPLLKEQAIDDFLELQDAQPTIVALTDGFNNIAARDICRDNADRLQILLRHLTEVREAKGVNIRRRPTVFTVGLGRPLRPAFELKDASADVSPVKLCGRRYVNRRIDGDLETYGIDNASLAWIADRGGGSSYVRRDEAGLGDAFKGAAAKRYAWFEVRYRLDPFWLRRAFITKLRLTSFATAEASVRIQPSAWVDAPSGVPGPDGWARRRSYAHTAVVVVPTLGLLVALSYLGAASFNVRRALFGRSRRPRARAPTASPPRGQPTPPAGESGGLSPPGASS